MKLNERTDGNGRVETDCVNPFQVTCLNSR